MRQAGWPKIRWHKPTRPRFSFSFSRGLISTRRILLHSFQPLLKMIHLRSIPWIILMVSVTMLLIAITADASLDPPSSVRLRGSRDGHASLREKRTPGPIHALSLSDLQTKLEKIGELHGPLASKSQKDADRKILSEALTELSIWVAAIEHAYSHPQDEASRSAITKALEVLSRANAVYLIPGWEGTKPIDGLSPLGNLARRLDDAFNSVFLRYTGMTSIRAIGRLRMQLQHLLGPDLYNQVALAGVGTTLPYYGIFHGTLWIHAELNDLPPPLETRWEIQAWTDLSGRLREGLIRGLNAYICDSIMGIRPSPEKDRIFDACKAKLMELKQVPQMGAFGCPRPRTGPITSTDSARTIAQEHTTTAAELREPDTRDDVAIPKGKRPKTKMDIGFLLNPTAILPAGPQVKVAPVGDQHNQEKPPPNLPTEFWYFIKLDLLRSLLDGVPAYSGNTRQIRNRDQPSPSQHGYQPLLDEISWWRAELTQEKIHISDRAIREFIDVVAGSLGRDLQPPPGRPTQEQAILVLEDLEFHIAKKSLEQASSKPPGRKRPFPPPFQG